MPDNQNDQTNVVQDAEEIKLTVMDQLGMSRNPFSERLDMFQNVWRRGILSWHLLRDPQVPLHTKAIPVVTLIYILSPLDLLPDILGPVGVLDDIILLGFAFDFFVRVAPTELVLKHARNLGFIQSG